MTRSKGDRLFFLVVYVLLALIGIVTLYPFWNIIVLSFNDAIDSLRGDIFLWPRKFTWANYEKVLSMPELSVGFRNSILRTGIGTVCSLIATSMLAYTLSCREYFLRKFIQRLFVITMYVSGGLIPYYFVIKNLGLRNNFIVYIVPMLLNAYYVIVTRSFMDTLPESLRESAKIDGANDLRIYAQIILPLSLPVLACIALFVAVDQWNAWYDTYMYASKAHLTTLQYELVKVINRSASQVGSYDQIRDQVNRGGGAQMTTPESIRMAITVVATAPILIVYPFIQRYFIQGMTLGAVKG